jgi:hypothetical protein
VKNIYGKDQSQIDELSLINKNLANQMKLLEKKNVEYVNRVF